MKRKRSPESEREEDQSPPKGHERIHLDRLIEEGKQEKRKRLMEELERKLMIINEINNQRRTSRSGVNNEPFPEGTFERLKSNDILGNVLEYLTDPIDVTETCHACPTFAKILNERRLLMMLPKVLDVLKTKVDDAFELKGEEMGQVCYQNWNSFCLKARGICKAWKETVDSHRDNARNDWVLTTEDDSDDDDPRRSVFTFDGEESIDKAMSSLISRGLTVSPIRDVYVALGNSISEPYYRKLVEYCKAYGSSVRFLNCSAHQTASGAIQRFFEIIKYTGNLKGLDIMFVTHDPAPAPDDNSDSDTDTDEDELLEPELGGAFQDVLNGTGTALSSLEYLSCSYWETNESLISQILRKCVNLKTLNLHCHEPSESLAGLTLERFQGPPTIITSTPASASWPLKHLEIYSPKMALKASVLFPAINNFRDTLEHLSLWRTVRMDSRNVRLELPRLKTFFVLLIQRGTLGLDDLLHLKSLEKISVDCVEYEDENGRVKVKTYLESGDEDMEKSNVWQCFSNLMRFKRHSMWGPSFTYVRPRPTSP